MDPVPKESSLHVVIFPFMAKGHTVPILHLCHLLLRRGAAITLFTTEANHSFISDSLITTSASIIDLPFPENVAGIPAGVESTDKLPSMTLLAPFANATKLMQPHFEKALEILPPVSFMITDGFLGWTLDSATRFGIPRFVFYSLGIFAMTLSHVMSLNRHILEPDMLKDVLFDMPVFSSVKVTINDFGPAFIDREPTDVEHYEFVMEQINATSKSYGLIVNSFHDLESSYLEYWNRECKPILWCVGPICLLESTVSVDHQVKPWIKWLDQKLAEGKPVLYIAFGSQAEISEEQFEEIKSGLEKSKVNFLWVTRETKSDSNGFEERVKDRGLVVKEWVDQKEVLAHESVLGFLSHCGLNSTLESLCAKVPILAWPLMAEQHLNARFVVDVLNIGVYVKTVDGSVRGFVKSEGLEESVRELMEGVKGLEARKNVKEVGENAVKAVEEGGSSWQTLNLLISHPHSLSTPYASV